jgi:hypothetical protein
MQEGDFIARQSATFTRKLAIGLKNVQTRSGRLKQQIETKATPPLPCRKSKKLEL